MGIIKPSGDKLFLVCADAPSLQRELAIFESWGLPHVRCAVNRAGLKIPWFDYWYSWHVKELYQWHEKRRHTYGDEEYFLVIHRYERDWGGLYVNLPVQGGSSTLDICGAAVHELGAARVAVAGLELPKGYEQYRRVWEAYAPELAPYIKVIDGPLVGVVGQATRQWCENGSEG